MISIIIPTLNEEDYLPLLLKSIQEQDYLDYEIIVADAGSVDKTLEIGSRHGATIVEGGLPAVGRNSGARQAKGNVLLFIDADVILPAHFLANAIREFQERALGLAGFPISIISKNAFQRAFIRLANIIASLIWNISPHAVIVTMVSKTVHESVGGYDESILLLEDVCYTKAVAKIAKTGYISIRGIITSDRRYRQEGWLLYGKNVLAELYTFFIGPIRSDIFHYKFNHYKKNNG